MFKRAAELRVLHATPAWRCKIPECSPHLQGPAVAVTAIVLWHTCDVLATQRLLIVEGDGHHEGGRKGAAGLGALETATLHGMCGKAWHLRTERNLS